MNLNGVSSEEKLVQPQRHNSYPRISRRFFITGSTLLAVTALADRSTRSLPNQVATGVQTPSGASAIQEVLSRSQLFVDTKIDSATGQVIRKVISATGTNGSQVNFSLTPVFGNDSPTFISDMTGSKKFAYTSNLRINYSGEVNPVYLSGWYGGFSEDEDLMTSGYRDSGSGARMFFEIFSSKEGRMVRVELTSWSNENLPTTAVLDPYEIDLSALNNLEETLCQAIANRQLVSDG